MQSILLIAKDPAKRRDFVAQFANSHAISSFDTLVFTPQGASFGIQEIKDIQQKSFLAAKKGSEKLLVIDSAQLLTTEAQNALLKLLEEPPAHTTIILSAITDTPFLPTIFSRCKVIALSEENIQLSEEGRLQYTGILESLLSGSISEKLAMAEKIATEKETVAEKLSGMILYLREKMLTNPSDRQIMLLLEKFQETYRLFTTTNVNTRMLLEHAFVN